jgi:hypothetical protein
MSAICLSAVNCEREILSTKFRDTENDFVIRRELLYYAANKSKKELKKVYRIVVAALFNRSEGSHPIIERVINPHTFMRTTSGLTESLALASRHQPSDRFSKKNKESPEQAPGYLRFLLEIFAYVEEQIPHTPSFPQQSAGY